MGSREERPIAATERVARAAAVAPKPDASAALVPDPEAVRLIPRAMALRYRFVPLGIEAGRFRVAMRDATDLEALDYIQVLTKRAPEPIAVSEEAIRSLLERAYGSGGQAGSESPEALAAEASRLSDRIDQAVSDMPVVRLFDTLLAGAVHRGATDIHLQPGEEDLAVRLRIDGVLHEAHRLPLEVAPALLARVKILAGLDIAERRLPQDGKIGLTFGNRAVDLRVSTCPTVQGECAVLRILDHARMEIDLPALGFPDDDVATWLTLLERPHGILLVTGPTGSGKTTTLYASLRMLDHVRRNVLTLEDPVEYRLPGIRQSQIHEKAGLTFAAGLRSMLRQDPDVILVGEMRDGETVQTAMRAALTGHLVLSTLHTNSAIGTITRLRDMGVEPFLLAASLSAILAQRLARRICPACVESHAASEAEKRHLGVGPGEALELRRGRGCPSCNGTGFSGRFAVSELLPIDEELRSAIASGESEPELLEIARRQRLVTLRERMAERVVAGWSTVDEMVRVVF